MRIAFATDGIFPHALGGIQRHTAFLASALVEASAQVDVFAPRGHEGDFPFTVRALDWPNAKPYPRTLWQWAELCATAVSSGEYDVVYGQGLTLLGRLGPGAPPSLFNPHGLEFCTIPGVAARVKAWPLRIGARRQARQASRTISLGGRLTGVVQACLGVTEGRIAVIPNGVDPGYFGSDETLREQGLVLFVGRLAANKGVDILCRALPLLPPSTHVVVAGTGPLLDSLRAQFRDPRIEFLGPVSDHELKTLYQRAAVLALPTRSDGMPTVILEAFCCSTPVVASNVGAISELVDETTGRLLTAATPEQLGSALCEILAMDADERRALGASARRRVAHFAWPAVAARTLEVLEEIAR